MPETLHSLILSAAPPFETLQKREASKTAEPHHTRPACVCVLAQGPALCDPMDCSPPGSCVHGILQAGRLQWAATASSGGSS